MNFLNEAAQWSVLLIVIFIGINYLRKRPGKLQSELDSARAQIRGYTELAEERIRQALKNKND